MKLRLKPEPKEGVERVIEKFLLIPRKIGLEWRWLERAKIRQRWMDDPFPDDRFAPKKWVNVQWIKE